VAEHTRTRTAGGAADHDRAGRGAGRPRAAAGLVRWLLAQAVASHALRDLCLVGVLAPVPDENWLWVGWLPHARPSTPPLAGPHVATTPDAAADLIGRLATLAGARSQRELASGAGRHGSPAAGARQSWTAGWSRSTWPGWTGWPGPGST
jgi:hypothetical protein